MAVLALFVLLVQLVSSADWLGYTSYTTQTPRPRDNSYTSESPRPSYTSYTTKKSRPSLNFDWLGYTSYTTKKPNSPSYNSYTTQKPGPLSVILSQSSSSYTTLTATPVSMEGDLDSPYDLFGYRSYKKSPEPDLLSSSSDSSNKNVLKDAATTDGEDSVAATEDLTNSLSSTFADSSPSTTTKEPFTTPSPSYDDTSTTKVLLDVIATTVGGDSFASVTASESLTTSLSPSYADTSSSTTTESLTTPSPNYDYQSSLYRLFDYKSFTNSDSTEPGDKKTPFCHTEEKVEYEDKCETYKEKTCHSLNREKCHKESVPTCRAVLKSNVEEVCLNVTNQVCSLVETEEQESVEEFYTVQTCFPGMEQVCDQSHELLVTEKEEVQCVELETVNCSEESLTITDSNCTETVEFNCQQEKYEEEDTCVQTPSYNCVTTPRQVMVTACQATTTLCHNLTSQQVAPIMTETCHDQPTTVCKMVERSRPAVRKTYSYNVSCSNVEKEVCNMMEKVNLEQSCVMEDRPVCEHHLGEEECKEERKLYCYQAEKLVEKEVCDDLWQTFDL
eukprot:GFUD01025308.1.p1 GENE.GFUD01025308.1~~GFUD01025308.1.p1  ORF type:complete len:559 (+),score=171.07 GFUD01025308.1:41-1717(+)